MRDITLGDSRLFNSQIVSMKEIFMTGYFFRVVRLALLIIIFVLGAKKVLAMDAEGKKRISDALNLPSQGLLVETISDTMIPGIFEVQLADGPIIYSTSDGRYFFSGDIYSVSKVGVENLSEQRRDIKRLGLLSQVESEDMIIFSPDQSIKASITVFTDITCFYCQKLHREVPELNSQGVEVRYLAYPRSGIGSEGYRKLASAWCAENRQLTLTKLKAGQSSPDNVCPGNPVSAQFALGQEAGVRGTPAIITSEGKMIPGYRSADDLMIAIGLK